MLDTKAKGKGLAYWRKAITEQLNLKVLPDATTFTFIERDYRDEIQKADAALKRTQVRSAMIANGEIDAPKSQQMAVDSGDMPKEFLPKDVTPDTTLASDEKPEDETETTSTTPTDPTQAAPTNEAATTPVNQSPAGSPAEALMQALRTKERVQLKEHSGAMVAFFLPKHIALKLYADTSIQFSESLITPPDEMHLTLVYLGKAADLDDKREDIESALSEFASEWGAVVARSTVPASSRPARTTARAPCMPTSTRRNCRTSVKRWSISCWQSPA